MPLSSAQSPNPTTLTVAAAADLSAAEPVLAAEFEKTNPSIKIRFVTGASTALAQQIHNGAPFDLFLSANINLVDSLHLDDAKIYTVGHIAILWKDGKDHPLTDLANPNIHFLAIANPKLAPYGLAAQQELQRLGLWDKLQPKIVYAENVRGTLQLFDSGNADAVLTALSLVINRHPQIVHSEIVQKAGIVPATKSPQAAHAFLDWLLSPPAQQILARYGFDNPNPQLPNFGDGEVWYEVAESPFLSRSPENPRNSAIFCPPHQILPRNRFKLGHVPTKEIPNHQSLPFA